jgi:hypothetical protein
MSSDLGHGVGLGGVRDVQVEQLAQQSAVLVAAGFGGELPDPYGRRVQQLLDDPVQRTETSARCSSVNSAGVR